MTSHMSLPPADHAVLASIRHGHALEIDSLNLQPEWLETPAARAAAAAALQLARLNKRVDIVNIRIHPLAKTVPPDAWGSVTHLFTNGTKDVDPADAVRAAHDAFVVREGDKLRQEMNQLYATNPQQFASEAAHYTQRLGDLFAGANTTKTKASDIYQEEMPTVKYQSKIPEMNEVLGGGYRNGMVYLYVGAPGHGKTSALRTDSANALIQAKRVSYIVSENSTVKALHGILRALTGLTEQELIDRRGTTPERTALLHEWLKWCDQYLVLYGIERYALPWVERILAWDKPDLLIIDYLRKLPGMTGVKGLVDDPVGDYCYGLLDLSNKFGVAIGSAGQMSADNAKKFANGKYLEDPPPFYGTDRPRQATDIYVGVRRSKGGGTSFYKWKDRFGNPIHREWVLPFDEKRQALAWPRGMAI